MSRGQPDRQRDVDVNISTDLSSGLEDAVFSRRTRDMWAWGLLGNLLGGDNGDNGDVELQMMSSGRRPGRQLTWRTRSGVEQKTRIRVYPRGHAPARNGERVGDWEEEQTGILCCVVLGLSDRDLNTR